MKILQSYITSCRTVFHHNTKESTNSRQNYLGRCSETACYGSTATSIMPAISLILWNQIVFSTHEIHFTHIHTMDEVFLTKLVLTLRRDICVISRNGSVKKFKNKIDSPKNLKGRFFNIQPRRAQELISGATRSPSRLANIDFFLTKRLDLTGERTGACWVAVRRLNHFAVKQ